MVTYRAANSGDAESIAQLHARSWQQNYRGAFSDAFLDGPVLQNRQEVWQKRLNNPSPTQHIIVAESDGTICGFACAYADNDPTWGTLLDNMHVRNDLKGQGVGSILFKSAAGWAYQKSPEAGFYLWVLVQNTNARKFYDKIGGTNQEEKSLENPDGTFSNCYRYVWTDIKTLL